jgi:copper chaperone
MSQTATFNVPDISCNHCKHAIESEVAQLPGVASVDVDVKAKTVTVVAEQLDDQAIVAAIDEAGYKVAA